MIVELNEAHQIQRAINILPSRRLPIKLTDGELTDDEMWNLAEHWRDHDGYPDDQ